MIVATKKIFKIRQECIIHFENIVNGMAQSGFDLHSWRVDNTQSSFVAVFVKETIDGN